ncbi:MAG: hypothetical protein KH409_07185 [Clostridium sp.]|nr:hypothetical protein [Clostridium sp.]
MRREKAQTTKDAQDAIPPPHRRKLRQNTFSEVQLEQAEKAQEKAAAKYFFGGAT